MAIGAGFGQVENGRYANILAAEALFPFRSGLSAKHGSQMVANHFPLTVFGKLAVDKMLAIEFAAKRGPKLRFERANRHPASVRGFIYAIASIAARQPFVAPARRITRRRQNRERQYH